MGIHFKNNSVYILRFFKSSLNFQLFPKVKVLIQWFLNISGSLKLSLTLLNCLLPTDQLELFKSDKNSSVVQRLILLFTLLHVTLVMQNKQPSTPPNQNQDPPPLQLSSGFPFLLQPAHLWFLGFYVAGIARLVPFSESLQQFISGIVLQALFGIIIPKVSAISALKTLDLFGSRLPFPTLSLFRAGAQGPGRFFPTSAAAYAGQREKAAQEQGRGEDCPERLSPSLPEEKLPGEGTDSGYVSRGRIGRPRSHPAGPADVCTITTRPGRWREADIRARS